MADSADPEESQFLSLALLEEVSTWVLQFFMVFGGVLPYLPQYRKIYRSRDAQGFSTYVCFVLLVANILRILFWYGKHYELPLLFQSVVMIAVMLAMLYICAQVSIPKDRFHPIHRITDLEWKYFWKWTFFSDYCLFVVILCVVGGLMTYLLSKFSVYVEVLGFASLLLEACLGMPQFWRNYKHKSTQGMSVVMVLLWFAGDAIKVVYFFVRHSPIQFLVCGSLQCLVDVAVLMQVCLY